jgi:hypothetical protein
MQNHRGWLLVLSCLLVDVCVLPARAQDTSLEARAVWADRAPLVDGLLNEAVWHKAPAFGGFFEREPGLRQPPPVETTFRVVYDLDNLYVAIHCADDRPDLVQGRIRSKDTFDMFHDDVVSVKLDPALDHRTTFGFALGAGGSRMDYQGIDETDFRVEFDTLWQGAVARTPDGWSAEFRIPWNSLGVDRFSPPVAMGLNITRDHARREATYDWALIPPPFSPIAASKYGTVTGFHELPERLAQAGKHPFSLALVPYGLVGFTRTPSPSTGEMSTEPIYDIGLDASAQFGSGWQGQLTVNTDFAQVDLDDQLVNLTRYGLYLPEKRDFFLKDQDLFRFGLPAEAQLLHTRRIGLKGGQAIPIMSGLKVVGQPLDWMRLGVVEVVTRPAHGEPWESHLVARGRAELGSGSHVGLMMTNRQSLEALADRNMVLGLDGAFRSGDTPLLLESFGLLSITGAEAGTAEVATGGNGASPAGTPVDTPVGGGGLKATWRGELFRPSVSYTYLHPTLRADLGFFRRVGIHRWGAGIEVQPRIGRFGLEKLTLSVNGDVVAAAPQADRLLEWGTRAEAELDWESGFEGGVVLESAYEVVEDDFTVGAETTIPAATYDALALHLWGATPGHLPVSGELQVTGKSYYGGRLYGAAAYLSARPSQLLRLSIGANYYDVTFDDARPDFATTVVNSKLSFGFTPDLGLDLFVGWNLLDELLLGHSRLRWTWAPGSDLFLVYQANVEHDFSNERYQSLMVKGTWRWP